MPDTPEATVDNDRKPPPLRIDDIQADVSNLFHLLDVITEELNEQDHGSGPTRNHGLDRIAALAQLARDSAKRIAEGIDENYRCLIGRAGAPT